MITGLAGKTACKVYMTAATKRHICSQVIYLVMGISGQADIRQQFFTAGLVMNGKRAACMTAAIWKSCEEQHRKINFYFCNGIGLGKEI